MFMCIVLHYCSSTTVLSEGDTGILLRFRGAVVQVLSNGWKQKGPCAGVSLGGELRTFGFKVPLLSFLTSSFLELSQETPFRCQPFLEKHFGSSLLFLFLQRVELGGRMVWGITYVSAAPLNCCWLYFFPCHYLQLTFPSPSPLSI